MKNKTIRNGLISIYNKQCFLNGVLSNENYITLHHIKKTEYNGLTTLENGALLSRYMHERLHFIEEYSISIYDYINDYLKYYKETLDEYEKTKMGIYVKKLSLDLGMRERQ